MASTTDQGRIIERVECFVVSHTLDPRTGPSIQLSTKHAYVVVKITDSDGRSGWGETYFVPGVPAIIEAASTVVIGRSATAIRDLRIDVRWTAEHPYAVSPSRDRTVVGPGPGCVRTLRSVATWKASIRPTAGRLMSLGSARPGSMP